MSYNCTALCVERENIASNEGDSSATTKVVRGGQDYGYELP